MQCSVITGEVSALHDNPHHPEQEGRRLAALSRIPDSVPRREAVEASMEDLRKVHLPAYLSLLQNASLGCTRGTIRHLDPDTYITSGSFRAARYAAGSAIAAAERSLDGEHAFSIMRPPGHHAMPGYAMGFCLINNIAVAAAAMLDEVDRVAILDWDVHHGNGTQYMFDHSDRVLYCSVHQAMFFPGTGHPWERGRGPGEGYSLNVPLSQGSTISDYAAVFSDLFCPLVASYQPEAILISAGMDCLYDDLLGSMLLSPGDFGVLTGLILDAVDLPLALVLEGGYSPSMGDAVRAIFSALGGERPEYETRPLLERTERMISLLGEEREN
ncbi:MAG: histone deacetylase [Methanomicrobiaceae archaeon]|nr:histone deacetylase [Methanomicrobiaceae archaeon]